MFAWRKRERERVGDEGGAGEPHFRCGFVVVVVAGVVPRQVSMVLAFPLLPAAATAKAVQG